MITTRLNIPNVTFSEYQKIEKYVYYHYNYKVSYTYDGNAMNVARYLLSIDTPEKLSELETEKLISFITGVLVTGWVQ